MELDTRTRAMANRHQSLFSLPSHVEADGFKAASFDFAETPGISEKPVGEGCQARIFRVDRTNSEGKAERYAIKVLKEELAKVDEEMRAFQREVNLLARLDHENICCIIAVGSDPSGAPCALLEWVDTIASAEFCLNKVAVDSAAKMAVLRKWPSARRIRLMAELAAALAYLHSGKAIANCIILHRDLKPDNLGLTASGQFKLLDFGLAVCLEITDSVPLCDMRYALTGGTGSTRYMAPEVCKRVIVRKLCAPRAGWPVRAVRSRRRHLRLQRAVLGVAVASRQAVRGARCRATSAIRLEWPAASSNSCKMAPRFENDPYRRLGCRPIEAPELRAHHQNDARTPATGPRSPRRVRWVHVWALIGLMHIE